MPETLVVMDIGDVILQTRPMAHYREIARHAGLAPEEVAERLESNGLVTQYEADAFGTEVFIDRVLELLLPRRQLTPEVLAAAWGLVVGDLDRRVASVARDLAGGGRLLLASNTNPLHWSHVRCRLVAAGVDAPACLLFRVRAAKPARMFFDQLTTWDARIPEGAVYIDDQAVNVAAAMRAGLRGHVHEHAVQTLAFLTSVAAVPSPP